MNLEAHPRINCIVPGCKRGTRRFPDSDEVICGKCWRFVRPATKRRKRFIERAWRQFEAEGEAHDWRISPEAMRRGDKLLQANRLVWRRCKADAIQGAAGI